MRTIILAAAGLLIGLSVAAQPTSLDKFYEKHKDADLTGDATSAFNGQNVMGSIIKSDGGAEAEAMKKKVKKVRLLAFNDDKEPDSAEFNGLIKNLHRDRFEDLLFVRKGSGAVTILTADLKGGLRELVVIGHGEGAFVLDVTGMFTDTDLAKIKVSTNEQQQN